MGAHGANGNEEEDGGGGGFFPLDMVLAQEMLKCGAGGAVAKHKGHLQRVVEVTRCVPVGGAIGEGGECGEAGLRGFLEERGDAGLEGVDPLEALFKEA